MGIENVILKGLSRAVQAVSGPPKDRDAETLRCALKGHPWDAAVKKRIIEFDAKYQEAYAIVLKSTYSDAKAEFNLLQVKQASDVAAGKLDGDYWGFQDIVENTAERQNSAKRLMMIISSEALKLCRPLAAQASTILSQIADDLDFEGAKKYAQYSVEFVPSPLANRLRELAGQNMRRCSGNGAPKKFVPFIFE